MISGGTVTLWVISDAVCKVNDSVCILVVTILVTLGHRIPIVILALLMSMVWRIRLTDVVVVGRLLKDVKWLC